LLPGIPIKHIKELKNKNDELDFEIAILTVPSNVAQEVANILIEAGVKGILNFAPVTLNSDDRVVIENVDFVISLKTLTYEIVSKYD
jgi:redox-sensing transcriptional repressor